MNAAQLQKFDELCDTMPKVVEKLDRILSYIEDDRVGLEFRIDELEQRLGARKETLKAFEKFNFDRDDED